MSRDWQAFFNQKKPLIMGILNITPDSFFRESRFDPTDPLSVARKAQSMQSQGADIIDIGAESTRPGASYLDDFTELSRLIPAVQAIRGAVSIPISVDTRKAVVARAALEAGADIINDISALRDDSDMLQLAKEYNCPVVLMHMQGNPQSMQNAPLYQDVVAEVTAFLLEKAFSARMAGVKHILIDPGIGFGKRYEDNLAILAALPHFSQLGYPVLIGHSRKGFIGTALGLPQENGAISPKTVEDRLAGSLAVSAWCARHGANILRVHDVEATADVLKMTSILDGVHA